MDWKLLATLLVSLFVAALGWWAVHYLSSRRDLKNERRKLRITYLLEAYRKLESASNRDDSASQWGNFETAIADIQLLGSPHQVALARRFALSMAKDGNASLDELIADLRRSLRTELELEPVFEPVAYLRFYKS